MKKNAANSLMVETLLELKFNTSTRKTTHNPRHSFTYDIKIDHAQASDPQEYTQISTVEDTPLLIYASSTP